MHVTLLATVLLSLLPQQSVPELAADIRNGDKDAAYKAARALSKLEGVEALSACIELWPHRLERSGGVNVADWLYSGMQEPASAEEVALLTRAAAGRKVDPRLRMLCLRALSTSEVSVGAAALLELAQSSSTPTLVATEAFAAIGALYAADRLSGAEALARFRVSLLVGRPQERLSGQAALALAVVAPALPDGDEVAQPKQMATDSLLSLLHNPKATGGDRALALRGLLRVRDDAAKKAARTVLSEPHPGLRTAALYTMLSASDHRGVPALIDALDDELPRGGRFVHDFAEALADLTGQQFGVDVDTWRLWWADFGEAFLEDPPEPRERTAVGDDATVARIFGLPVHSNRVAVVVDGSGSMRMFEVDGISGAEAAKRELGTFLEQLDDDALMNAAVIERKPERAFKRLSANSKRNRKRAVDFIGKRPFSGASSLYDTLIEIQNDPGVDTIVYIGDGGGSWGLHAYAGHMLVGLEREFARTGVRVHAICIGSDKPKTRFLEDLAEMTGGRTVRVGD